MRTAIIFIAILSIPAFSFAATIHVPGDYPSIQGAIDSAVNGDTVLVDPGTYVENINFNGKPITVMSSSGPEVTVIDGGSPVNPDFGSVVMFENGEGLDSVLDGFTLTNGTGNNIDPYWGSVGGAIYCGSSSPTIINNIMVQNSSDVGSGMTIEFFSSPIVMNNVIKDNPVKWGAGGIDVYYHSTPTISHNIVSDHISPGHSGAMDFVDNCSGILSNNIFLNNSADGVGGVINIYIDSNPIITNNVFCGNSCTGLGGAISCYTNCSPEISGNVFSGNSAQSGGAISCFDNSNSLILNNTFHGNSAETGGAISVSNNSAIVIANTILWNNEASVQGTEIYIDSTSSPSSVAISHSDVMGGQGSVYVDPGCILNWGSGMIEGDPLFVDAADNDFHILYPSPCRNSGDNSVPGLPDDDFEGDPRMAYGTVDMGADEFHPHLYFMGEPTPGSKVMIKIIGLPGTWPVSLFIGSGVLDPPIPTWFGDWYLECPLKMVPLFYIPCDGLRVRKMNIPKKPSGPYSLPMQALIGFELSNLCVMDVQ